MNRCSRLAAFVAAAFALQGAAWAAHPYKSSPCEVPGLRELVLQHVNAARARGAVCGGQRFAGAQPVQWSGQLYEAASGHSQDMADNNYFDHADRRGRHAENRVDAVGYKWRSAGENIAAGQSFTAGNVVAGWLASSGHCRNIMDPAFTEVAVACAARSGTAYGSYWTMVLGRR